MTVCLRFLGAAWTPDLLWFLREEPRRFGDLRRDLSGVSAKVLTGRLRDLQRLGVVRRTIVATSPATVEYSLTQLGERFLPLLEQIATLGATLQVLAPTTPEPLALKVARPAERGDGEQGARSAQGGVRRLAARRSERGPEASGRVGPLDGSVRASAIRSGGAP